ncbi:MAG: HlyD family efflux transporter periplasmic adaptor subunit [Pirellulaceae bacterium]|nr:HlyD family efflux transporter periplasmic adaptor subunit [Pirellulaceae bacterium]
MSTEQSLNPELIEQTKHQIRSLVSEIAQLSKSDIAPEEFYAEFLNRVVQALAAVGGAVWVMSDEGRLTLQYQTNLQKSGLRDNEEGQRQHGRLLQRVMTSGEAALVPPHSGIGEDDQDASNPTDFLLVLGPLKTDVEVVGVVEVLQRSETGISAQRGYLRFLAQMCDLAADFIKSRQLRHFSDRQVLWTQLEDFTRRVHGTLDPYLTAYTIANEGRRLIECDRVSVAIRRGRKCRIEAVSGQDLFDKRSNTIRLLGQLATRVTETGDPVWYSGDTSNMAPQVEDAVQEYVDESHSKTVAVLPLCRPEPTEEERDPEKIYTPEEPIGALIVEQIEDSRIPETMVHRVAVVAEHSSVAMANAMEHQNLFLMPLWRALGKTRWVLHARTLPKTVAVVVAVVAVILGLIFVPWPYQVTADGTLEPVERSAVFARIDGTVKQMHVKHNDMVTSGDLLVELRSTGVAHEILELTRQIATTREQIVAKQSALFSSELREDEKSGQLGGEINELEAQLDNLLLLLEVNREKERDLKMFSPRDGRVLTWDLEYLLEERPVQRGQQLMEVADIEGPWQVELLVPDDRMGQIILAQNRLRERGEDDALPVTFFLWTETGMKYKGKIKEVAASAEVRGEKGNTVLMKVDISDAIDRDKLVNLRPGAEVKAKIYCGHRAVGYVLFHDVWAWIQSRVLFRF